MDSHNNAAISSGAQAVARESPARTLFAERTLAYQEMQTRTKGDVLGTGLGILAMGLLVTVVCGVGILLVGGFWVFILGALIGIVLILVGPVVLLVGVVTPTKKVTCPWCGTEHRVLRSTQKYICPKCLGLLRLGKGPVCHMAFVTCPYCDHKAAVSEDHGLFLCSNCGLLCTSAGDRQSTEDTNCPTCGREVPDEAIYCVSCDSTLKTNLPAPPSEDPGLAYDEDWVAGKDAVGHFHFARVLLEQIRAETPCPPSNRHEESPIRRIDKALLSLGEVAADPNTRPRCLEILPDVDQVYAGVLRWELDVAEIFLSAKDVTPFIEEVIQVLVNEIPKDEQHISARRQLERLLGDAVQSAGSIGKWSDKFLVWGTKETRSAIFWWKTGEYDVLTGCKGLRNEVTRFSRWLEGRGLAIPESPRPSPASDTQQPRDAGFAQDTAPGVAAMETDVCRLDIESQSLPVSQKYRQATRKESLYGSIGIETSGGTFTAVLEGGSCIPCEKTEVFSTGADNQSSLDIHVLQGNGKSISDPSMREVGRFTLKGIPPARAGKPQIEVTFSVTCEGEFVLRAKDLATGHGIEVAGKGPVTVDRSVT